MACPPILTVHLQRLPHRDAASRLRLAYRCLRKAQGSAPAQDDEKKIKPKQTVQELVP